MARIDVSSTPWGAWLPKSSPPSKRMTHRDHQAAWRADLLAERRPLVVRNAWTLDVEGPESVPPDEPEPAPIEDWWPIRW
jgi:hypothetical protein